MEQQPVDVEFGQMSLDEDNLAIEHPLCMMHTLGIDIDNQELEGGQRLLETIRRCADSPEDFVADEKNRGLITQVIQLLADDADPNYRANYANSLRGMTSLHFAAMIDSKMVGVECVVDIVDLLIYAGALVNAVDDQGSTPLIVASNTMNKTAMERLIAAGADVNMPRNDGLTSLHIAAVDGNSDIVRVLIAAGASPNVFNNKGNTPLMLAVGDFYRSLEGYYEERLDVAHQLIAAGANINATGATSQTSLHSACLLEDEEMVSLLLAHGASTNAIGEAECTPLCIAVRLQNMRMVEMLISAGCDLNYVNVKGESSRTAVQTSILCNDIDMLKCLLEHGADPNNDSDELKCILFHAMTEKPFAEVIDIVRLLLSHGARLYDGCFGNSRSALEFVLCDLRNNRNYVSSERKLLLELLLEHGLDLRQYSPQLRREFSPLHEAFKNDMLPTLLKFNTRGSLNLEHEDMDGCSVLMVAVKKGALRDVKLLIEYGADVNHVDEEGYTPTESLALKTEVHLLPPSFICVEYLVEAGAKVEKVLQAVTVLASSAIAEEFGHRLRKACIIIKYRVLYESKNPSITDPIAQGHMGGSDDLWNYYESCKSEIDLLKTSLLHGSISYYDILASHKDFHKRVRNKRVYEAFDEKRLKDYYPVYAQDICRRFQSVRFMHELWEEAVRNLSKHVKLDSDAYYSIFRRILDYLGKDDLNVLGMDQS